MILADGVKAYEMAIPFTFNNRPYPAGSVIVVFDVGDREAYLSHEWTALADLKRWRR